MTDECAVDGICKGLCQMYTFYEYLTSCAIQLGHVELREKLRKDSSVSLAGYICAVYLGKRWFQDPPWGEAS